MHDIGGWLWAFLGSSAASPSPSRTVSTNGAIGAKTSPRAPRETTPRARSTGRAAERRHSLRTEGDRSD